MGTPFDQHVEQALSGLTVEAHQRSAIEKELIHHEILRQMSQAGILPKLVFFGGTSLRLCWDSARLSEDLDFKLAEGFSMSQLKALSGLLQEGLSKRFGLEVFVDGPSAPGTNTNSWVVRLVTQPGSKYLPQQRIHIDVCTLTCFDPTPRLPHNYYAIELGTRELIINAQSKRESFTDKLLALALRNRLQPRDLWDLAWIKQTTADTSLLKLKEKLLEQGVPHQHFIERLRTIRKTLANPRLPSANYMQDLGRFLPTRTLKTLENPDFWRYVGGLVEEQTRAAQRLLSPQRQRGGWEM